MPRIHVHCLTKWSCLFTGIAILAAFSPPPAAARAGQQKPQQGPGMPRSERHESRHEIDQLEEAWRNAALHHDAAAMASLLSEDYIGITASGTLQSKDETLASLRAGALQFSQLDLSDRKVRFYGQTALVTSRAEISGTNPNGPISGSYRYTRVYVRDDKGAWKIVSFEASRIRDTGEGK
jgi:ketosteroid isomerase-like protein